MSSIVSEKNVIAAPVTPVWTTIEPVVISSPPCIIALNPHQNPENRSSLDHQASEHCSKDVLPAEACSVNQLLEEGEDEHADSPSERKEQHPPRRNLMLRQNHRYGNHCAGESSYSEVRPLVHSPIGEKTLEKFEYPCHRYYYLYCFYISSSEPYTPGTQTLASAVDTQCLVGICSNNPCPIFILTELLYKEVSYSSPTTRVPLPRL